MKTLLTFVTALVIALGFAGASFAAEPTSAKSPEAVQVMEKVNINSADAETLATNLHRVGVKKAEAIVAWRQANGKFTSVEQLLEIKGIGESILAANRDRVIL
jgi:competence protein ComEA